MVKFLNSKVRVAFSAWILAILLSPLAQSEPNTAHCPDLPEQARAQCFRNAEPAATAGRSSENNTSETRLAQPVLCPDLRAIEKAACFASAVGASGAAAPPSESALALTFTLCPDMKGPEKTACLSAAGGAPGSPARGRPAEIVKIKCPDLPVDERAACFAKEKGAPGRSDDTARGADRAEAKILCPDLPIASQADCFRNSAAGR